MNELKFRAIISDLNPWIFYFNFKDLTDFPNEQKFYSYIEILIPWLRAGNQPDRYTGCKDKNDVEIYENDIVKYADDIPYYIPIIVRFGKFTHQNGMEIIIKAAGIYLEYNGYTPVFSTVDRTYEIIGNIHQNPELLESK